MIRTAAAATLLVALAGEAGALSCAPLERTLAAREAEADLVLRGRATLGRTLSEPAPAAKEAVPDQDGLVALPFGGVPAPTVREVEVTPVAPIRGSAPNRPFTATFADGPCFDWRPSGAEQALFFKLEDGAWRLTGGR